MPILISSILHGMDLLKMTVSNALLIRNFSLGRISDILVPKNIPAFGARHTRYRTKLVLAIEDMQINPGGKMRKTGRALDDGSGLMLKEGIVWLDNGKGIPIYPDAYVPLNQAQMITIRHGKSIHESGVIIRSLSVPEYGIPGRTTNASAAQ